MLKQSGALLLVKPSPFEAALQSRTGSELVDSTLMSQSLPTSALTSSLAKNSLARAPLANPTASTATATSAIATSDITPAFSTANSNTAIVPSTTSLDVAADTPYDDRAAKLGTFNKAQRAAISAVEPPGFRGYRSVGGFGIFYARLLNTQPRTRSPTQPPQPHTSPFLRDILSRLNDINAERLELEGQAQVYRETMYVVCVVVVCVHACVCVCVCVCVYARACSSNPVSKKALSTLNRTTLILTPEPNQVQLHRTVSRWCGGQGQASRVPDQAQIQVQWGRWERKCRGWRGTQEGEACEVTTLH